MKTFPRYLILIAASLSFAWSFPFLYSIAAKKKVYRPFVSYSAVTGGFVQTEQRRGQTVYTDMEGNVYNLREYEKLLPLLFTRDLQKWGEYPQSVGGVHVPIDKALNYRDSARISPHFVNLDEARVQLFPLFEAESDFTSLEFPKELFSIKERMEFINAAENRVDEEKSALFTEALKNAGFAFPAKKISGNTYPRKPYDFGYFVLDSKGEFYHIYQAKSAPVVKNTGIAPENKAAFLMIRENSYLPYYGLLVDIGGNVYQILKEDYALIKLNAGAYNPYRDSLIYILDPLNITLKVSNELGENIRVTTPDGELVKELKVDYERNIYAGRVYDALFPFILRNNPYKYGDYIDFVLSKNYPAALALSAALAVIYMILLRKKKRLYNVIDTALIILGGVYALAAILLLDAFRSFASRTDP
jgi:hypothetical protein